MLRKSQIILDYEASGLPNMGNTIVKIESNAKTLLVGTYLEKLIYADQWIIPLLHKYTVSADEVATFAHIDLLMFPDNPYSFIYRTADRITVYHTPSPVVHQLSQCLKLFSGQILTLFTAGHTLTIVAQT